MHVKSFTCLISERVKSHLESSMTGEVKRPKSESEISYLWGFIDLLSNINQAAESVGKDGKFQIFICVGVRYDHICYVADSVYNNVSGLPKNHLT